MSLCRRLIFALAEGVSYNKEFQEDVVGIHRKYVPCSY